MADCFENQGHVNTCVFVCIISLYALACAPCH